VHGPPDPTVPMGQDRGSGTGRLRAIHPTWGL